MSNPEKNSLLIVDDEKINILTFKHILGDEYIIYTAKNGHEAIETAKKHLPDVILLDILMPDMNGYEVLELMKGIKEISEIPVIFVTGLTNVEDEEKGLNLGAADYITKPFNPAIVKLRVRNQIHILNLIKMVKQKERKEPIPKIV
jgi:CheY-like chemotaxis protein